MIPHVGFTGHAQDALVGMRLVRRWPDLFIAVCAAPTPSPPVWGAPSIRGALSPLSPPILGAPVSSGPSRPGCPLSPLSPPIRGAPVSSGPSRPGCPPSPLSPPVRGAPCLPCRLPSGVPPVSSIPSRLGCPSRPGCPCLLHPLQSRMPPSPLSPPSGVPPSPLSPPVRGTPVPLLPQQRGFRPAGAETRTVLTPGLGPQ